MLPGISEPNRMTVLFEQFRMLFDETLSLDSDNRQLYRLAYLVESVTMHLQWLYLK